MSKISLNPIKATWNSDESIEFEIIYENSRDCNFLNVTIHRIFKLNELAIGQFMLPLINTGNNKFKVTVKIPNIGVYYISKLTAEKYPISKSDSQKYDMHHPLLFDPFADNEFFSPYFLISNDNANYTSKAIKEYVNNIFEEREKSLILGTQNEKENSTYEVIVLCKDVYLSSISQFKSCKVKPYIPSTNNDLLEHINKCLLPSTWQKFEDKEVRKDILYSPNPQVVFEFPRVYSTTHDDAVNLVISELEVILNAYSITRNCFGEIQAVAVRNKQTEKQFLTFSQLDYVGNIMCGDIFGENPFLNNAIADSSREDSFLQLCISLFNQASIETNIEFAFTKYWSVLETLAESKKYSIKRLHKVDLDGIKLTSLTQKQKPGKKDYVRELIRDYKIMDGNNINNLLITSIPEIDKKSEALLSVWYNHRNCAVHGGGCVRDELKGCKESCSYITERYIKQQRGVEVQQNHLLNTLRQTIRQILLIESTKNTEDRNLVNQFVNEDIAVVRKRNYISN
ncbi:hypothetical protein ACXR6G_19975 [Ancylomarina sp. YFZ004]